MFFLFVPYPREWDCCVQFITHKVQTIWVSKYTLKLFLEKDLLGSLLLALLVPCSPYSGLSMAICSLSRLPVTADIWASWAKCQLARNANSNGLDSAILLWLVEFLFHYLDYLSCFTFGLSTPKGQRICINCPTRSGNTLDKCYGSVPEAYEAIPLPPLGFADYLGILLAPA